ncbi:FAD:protein FMN transferase [Paenibacillus favisporus]|uniref:FAD:protein FMN transferase n=1 Tax=Paenibacillus favisporus TaxID=221028 RepID=UPI0019826485|nr:FAD:protein FMN transferase [Paenibacillus favisporus]
MHTFRAMNTEFVTYGLFEAEQRDAESWFAFVEKHLTRFDPGSELSRLNRSAGRPFMATPILFEAVSVAVDYYHRADGLFNPFLGQLLTDLGYGRSFGETAAEKKVSSQAPDRTEVNARLLGAFGPEIGAKLNPLLRSIELPPAWSVDLGGIAKGWSAEKFAGMMCRKGIAHGAVSAGGDMMLWGGEDRPQQVNIADPFALDRDIDSLVIRRKTGVATSSRLKRKWLDGEGQERHHILDPRTMMPSLTDVVQATVIHPSLTAAEVYAKCLLILGLQAGTAWLERKHPAAAAVLVCEDGSVCTAGFIEAYRQENGKEAG